MHGGPTVVEGFWLHGVGKLNACTRPTASSSAAKEKIRNDVSRPIFLRETVILVLQYHVYCHTLAIIMVKPVDE
jgi:hypothetical protein